MLIENFHIDRLECINDKKNMECHNKDCYSCIFNQYALSFKENCYTDKKGIVRCIHCQEEIEGGYCKCNK